MDELSRVGQSEGVAPTPTSPAAPTGGGRRAINRLHEPGASATTSPQAFAWSRDADDDDAPVGLNFGAMLGGKARETTEISTVNPLAQAFRAGPPSGLANALALGGMVAGCAVGAFALGPSGLLVTAALEALAFAGGLLFSRAALQEVERAKEELEYEATHDALTGLFNRGAIMRKLEVALDGHLKESPVAVLLGDVDHFKKINDTYGHQAGDEVLREVSQRMQLSVRAEDSVGRYGGEEMVVVLRDATTERAGTLGERIRSAVCGRPFATVAGPIPVTISIGVASTDRLGRVPPAELLRAADGALYRAKESGRNRVLAAAARQR